MRNQTHTATNRCWENAWPRTLLPLMPLLVLPAVGRAQFTYQTNNGTITITGYTGNFAAVTIPSTINGLPVTAVGDYAFALANLNSVTIPDSVTIIGVAAFQSCTNLVSVTLGNNVTSIGEYAFAYCASLPGIALPNSVTGPLRGTFSGCTILAHVTLGDNITSVGDFTFDDCNSLADITIPSSVTSLGYAAFRFCYNLPSVTLPDGLTTIWFYAFQSCINLTNVTIPDSVTVIKDGAFSICTRLTNVTIPNNVTVIRAQTFAECRSLMDITIPSSVTTIEYGTFQYCTSLTNVMIGSGVNQIGNGVFSGCTNLTAITVDPLNPVFSDVGGVLLDLGQTTLFRYPTGKTGGYTIPDSVTSISSYAFDECAGLTSVTIPDSVINIDNDSFGYCASLTNVTIGNGLTSIGALAFESCTNLAYVYFSGDTPSSVNPRAFENAINAIVYYLPWTTGWTTFTNCPTALWLPRIETGPPQTGQFGFDVRWAGDVDVVVEVCTNLTSPAWIPISTITLINGWSQFVDPILTNIPSRFYRISWP